MPEFSDLEKLNEPPGIANSIGFWIYLIQEDIIKLSKDTMENFGIKIDIPCSMESFKSHILGVDISLFSQSIEKWIIGDTSNIIRIRIIDNDKQIKTLQIKGRVRFNKSGEAVQLYGAYIDISNREN